ncbi:MAG TPA: PAS domain S-box protein, partial [Armatimonadota bacterium]|nr:PAS domain S-box protein [Armatimonadota bacterium]
MTDGYVLYLHDVTSRQQAKQLSTSETRLRSILSVAIDAIFVIDESGMILQANPATGRIFGYTQDELIGHSINRIIPAPIAQEHGRYMARYLHTAIPHIIGTVREVNGQRKNGEIFPCELSVAESSEHGERRKFVGIIRDISERKKADAALENLYRQNELILNAAAEGIFGLDKEDVFVFVNPAAAKMLGYSILDLIGRNAHETIHHHRADGEPYPINECPVYESYITGETYSVADEVFWRKDGSSFDVQYLSSPIWEDHQLAGTVVTFNDISERKQLERELINARARLESILNTVPLPLFVIDANGDITMYNQEAREFYGDMLERNEIFQGVRLHPDTRAPWPSYEWPIVRALREGRVIHDVEQLIIFPDGREIPVLVHAAPVTVDNRIIAAVGVLQDLSQLKAADRAKDAFLALISHELKSPLTAIISWADLAKEDTSLSDEALDVILRSARAQQRIINDLLDLSRVIYGKMTLEKEPIDVWDIAKNTAEGLRRTIEERGITLEVMPPSVPLPVMGDPVRLGQVITNLLNNAVKFTPAGGRITLAGTREGDMARVSVRDTGRGIPPEQLSQVFQRFQQLGRERVSGGLGLGLAVVRGLVELHGGRVEAFSAGEGKGSTFTVWLPLRHDETAG